MAPSACVKSSPQGLELGLEPTRSQAQAREYLNGFTQQPDKHFLGMQQDTGISKYIYLLEEFFRQVKLRTAVEQLSSTQWSCVVAGPAGPTRTRVRLHLKVCPSRFRLSC